MIFTRRLLLIFTVLFLSAAAPADEQFFHILNPELAVVYRPPVIRWDADQWAALFRDPSPPAGWAMMAVGRESCSAIPSSWLNSAKRKGLRLALLIDSPLSPREIERIVDCAVPLGFQRAIIDEYVTYNLSQNRPICTILSEMRGLSQRVKSKHPSFVLGLDENWNVWMEHLRDGSSNACGSYPYFKVDYAGLSVFTKYGTPASGVCDHPTPEEMEEQIVDLQSTVKDYSRSGKAFVWQLNENYYPDGPGALQFFREMKSVHGYDRFFLYGPTNGNDVQENWGYKVRSGGERCPGAGYEWFLPARDYLVRMSEGRDATINLQGPANANRGSRVSLSGFIRTNTGVPVNGIQLQLVPPVGSVQRISREIRAPGSAFLAIVGVRVNSQLQDNIKEPANFSLLKASLTETGKNRNLIGNGEFDDDLRNWIVTGSAPVRVIVDEFGKSLTASPSAHQTVSVTSLPVPVIPGRSYTVSFDARIFREARNGGYFFVAWLNPGEVRRDRLFMKFPDRTTIATTSSRGDGKFSFFWQPQQSGIYSLFAFFPGSSEVQPVINKLNVSVH